MILSRYCRKLRVFSRFTYNDKKLILKITIMSALIRFIILVVPFKYIKKYLGEEKSQSDYIPSNEEKKYIQKISVFIEKVCKNTPWQSKCLVQAIIAQRLLSSKQIESTMYLGVGKDKNDMVAHAWVLCGEYYVSGWSSLKYGVVAKFKK